MESKNELDIKKIEKQNINAIFDLFKIIKQLSEEYFINIRKYEEYTINYYEKLSKLNFTSNLDLKINNNNELIDLCSIINFINKVPIIINEQTNSLKKFIESIDSTIVPLENIIKNEISLFDEKIKEFEIITKNFKKNKKNNKELMEIFNDTENEIINYYYQKNDKINYEESRKNMIEKIKKTKEIEKLYITEINDEKNFYLTFYKNTEELILQLMERIKSLLENFNSGSLSFILYFDNSFSSILKLIKNDLQKKELQSEQITRIIESNIKLKNLKNVDFPCDKYKIKIINKKNQIKNNETNDFENIKKYSLQFKSINENREKRAKTLPYLKLSKDDIISLVQKFYENFTMVDKSEYDLAAEIQKNEIKKLTDKLLNLDKEHKKNKELIYLTKDEHDKLFEMLENPINRFYFLERLNKIRSYGNFEVDKDVFNDILKIFKLILSQVKIDKDILCIKYCIILSQTFYFIKDEKKYFLQSEIKSHFIFKFEKTWNILFEYLIKEAKESFIKNNKNIYNDNEIKDRFREMAFGQILPFVNNMIEFDFDIKRAENICIRLLDEYDIKGESRDFILLILKPKIEKSNTDTNSKDEGIEEKK